MTKAALRFEQVTAESAKLRRSPLTIWLSPSALTEWSENPVEAFEIPRSQLRGASLVRQPRGHKGCAALVATLHGRYVRWLIPVRGPQDLEQLDAWVESLRNAS